MKKISLLLLSMLLLCGVVVAKETQPTKLLRFPTIHNNNIVFTYAGDLYSTTTAGGEAKRLTAHVGYESFARFSPDGSKIAFTGQYDGNTEVFLMDAEGSTPKRLTTTATLSRDDVSDRMGPNNIVMTWTPDGKEIVFRTRRRTPNAFQGQLQKVSVDGGATTDIPLTNSGFCSYSADGSKLAFNWVFREFRTWKYYKGGMADDIRIFDEKTGEVKKITDNVNQDIIPMWIGDQIFYISDRDRTMNLFVYNTVTEETKKVTDFTEYDIKFPSSDQKSIVFENGGEIYRYDVATSALNKIEVTINSDNLYSRNEWKDGAKYINSASASPKGDRVAFAARGEVFNLPAKEGITYNITRSSGAHDRDVSWSPDGKTIAWVSDKSGEFEIWGAPYDGSSEPYQITDEKNAYIYEFGWSPDASTIIYYSKKGELKLIDVKTGATTVVTKSTKGPYFDYAWSPDSKWVAFAAPEAGNSKIQLYNIESKAVSEVTDSWYDSSSPVFSPDGKYLFFTSSRDFSPTYSRTEWNHVFTEMSRIYFVTLNSSVKSPLAPSNDVVSFEAAEKKSDEPIAIEIEGIKDRIDALPTARGNYYNLVATEGKIFYGYYGQKGGGTKMYDLTKKKESSIGRGVSLDLLPDNKHMLAMQGGKFGIINIPSGEVKISTAIPTDKMKISVDMKAEWNQIYNESWRHMRDFFYDPNMHGVDWDAIKIKYSSLLPYVNSRHDLSYLIGEMIGELNVGHAYVNNGEYNKPMRVKTGLLGAEISQKADGYPMIEKILDGANWDKDLVSPLNAIGVNVNEGDYIVAINGVSTENSVDMFSLLVGKANEVVELTINSKPTMDGAHKELVKTISDESKLYYYNWVQSNIEKVSKATDGKIGYIHVPDMGVPGLIEFAKHYYPQTTKEGLIIDVRGNGGGNISPMLIERLKRDITYATMHTGYTDGDVNPVGTHLGPKVALCDRYSASDGDLFPYRFKYNKLGTLIGTRTWGGVVGYSGSIPCIDGGSIVTPSYAPFAADGSEFIIEGRGVVPNIELDNDPHKEYLGEDDQLSKAIEVILKQLETEKRTVPAIPAFPNKSL